MGRQRCRGSARGKARRSVLIGFFSAQLQLESGSTMATIIVASLVGYLVAGVIIARVPGVTLREPRSARQRPLSW
jgi:hypothetical protein